MTTTMEEAKALLPQGVLAIGEERLVEASGGRMEHVFPGNGEACATFPLAGPEEIDRAVRAARVALPDWRGRPANERRDLLLRLAEVVRSHASELGAITVLDNGTPI